MPTVSDMTTGLYGKLVGDNGDISQVLFEHLHERGFPLLTNLKKEGDAPLHDHVTTFSYANEPLLNTSTLNSNIFRKSNLVVTDV